MIFVLPAQVPGVLVTNRGKVVDQTDLYKEGLSSLPQKFFKNDWRYFCSMGPITSLLLLLQPILQKMLKRTKMKNDNLQEKFFSVKIVVFCIEVRRTFKLETGT